MKKLNLFYINMINISIIFSYFLLMRVVYFFYFKNDLIQDLPDLLQAFYLGSKFDLRTAALLVLPVVIISPFTNLLKKTITKIISLYFLLLSFLVNIFYFTDFGFSSYLKTRLNSNVFKFLENPIISFNMVYETYPVYSFGFLLILSSLILYRILLYNLDALKINSLDRKKTYTALSILVSLVFIYAKFSFYPLRWSEAFFSSNDKLGNFALNPIHYFVDSLRYKDTPYSKDKTLKYLSSVKPFLGLNSDFDKLSFERLANEKQSFRNKMNVILIIMESMAANKTSVFDNKLDPTPSLRAISQKGYFFNRFFTPTEATARSVFATVTGIPDVSSGKFKSSSRNPFTVNQHTILNEFKDHEKYYFLGGSANWGNIRGIFSNNISGIKIYEEDNLKSDRNDVWGVSDLDLFLESQEILIKEDKPFFAIIQSSGFHRPYTLPEKRGDFKVNEISESEALANGFRNSEEYNSIRFQDYALGQFYEKFKKTKHYSNTLIVIIGDHGLPSSNSKNLPEGFFEHDLVKHHVPLVFHVPSMQDSVKNSAIVSQLDLLPSIADYLGISYKNTTLGRSIFDMHFDDDRFAFMYSWQVNPRRIALIDKDFYFVDLGGKTSGLYEYNKESFKEDVKLKYPLIYKKFSTLAEGLFETSKYMLYHNKK